MNKINKQQALINQHDAILTKLSKVHPTITAPLRLMGKEEQGNIIVDPKRVRIIRKLHAQLTGLPDSLSQAGQFEANLASGHIRYGDLEKLVGHEHFLSQLNQLATKRKKAETTAHMKTYTKDTQTKFVTLAEYLGSLRKAFSEPQSTGLNRRRRSSPKYPRGTVGYDVLELPKQGVNAAKKNKCKHRK